MKQLFIICMLALISSAMCVAPVTDQLALKTETEMREKVAFLHELPVMEFSAANFYQALVYMDITNPDYVFRQAVLESANFTSYVWTEYNNPFGMKFPVMRTTTAYGPVTNMKYAGYVHWSNSIADMQLFQQWYNNKGWDFNYYEDFLAGLPYAEDKLYIQKLNNITIDIG